MNITKSLTGRFSGLQKNTRQFIIVHDTASGNATLNNILRFFALSNSVSIHYVIGKAGEVVQMVSENNVAWHCGVSKWDGITFMNRCSIGIEVLSDGKEYTQAQRIATWELCKDIMKRNKIQTHNVLRHADIAMPRGRKQDISLPFYKPWGDTWSGFQVALSWPNPFNNLPK